MFKPMTEAAYRKLWQRLETNIMITDIRHGVERPTMAYREEYLETLVKHNISFYRALGLIVDEEPAAAEEPSVEGNE